MDTDNQRSLVWQVENALRRADRKGQKWQVGY
jgi:hypothetical protein